MTSLTAEDSVELDSETLHVQLDNARNFTNTLQQIAWALSLRIKDLGSSTSNAHRVSNNKEETKDRSLSKKDLMMQLRKITLIMEQMQMKMEQGLEVYNASNSLEEQKRRASAISRTILKCQKITDRVLAATNLNITAISDPRKTMLKDEVASLEDDYKNEKYSTEGALSCLKQVVGRLRSVEETFEFHSNIVADRASLVQDTNQAGKNDSAIEDSLNDLHAHNHFTNGNFAYGSTPFSTFSLILSNGKFQSILRQMKRNREEFVVFGSSAGWLNFFASLAFGVVSTGYEILPSLVRVANQVKKDFRVEEHSKVEFHCMDMLKASLKDTRIIMLCSQCWDNWLIDLVHAKLLLELKVGSVIIDYSSKFGDTLDSLTCPPEKDTAAQPTFESFLEVKAPVSWNPGQQFHCYVRTA